jgi:hypothetical protein
MILCTPHPPEPRKPFFKMRKVNNNLDEFIQSVVSKCRQALRLLQLFISSFEISFKEN